jgi:nicotinate-nucleotide--dimethylbenzimidazole phosphoribosyltransferase
LAKHIVEITQKEKPLLKNKVIFTMAGDHGVTEEGISAYPKEVTPQMVYNFLRGGAGINVLARHVGARVMVVDMGVAIKIQNSPAKAGSRKLRGKYKIQNFKDKKINFGTKNFAKGPAMTKYEAVRSIEAGIEIFEEEMLNSIDIVGTGDMGIGNTTSSSAIASVITGKPVEDMTGRGTGIDDNGLFKKIAVIKKAISMNKPDGRDAIDVLAKVGGFEIGGLVGVILAAASRRVPGVIDGFISGAAALLAYRLEPKVKDYMIAAHCSVEPGHKLVLKYMDLKPLLDLGMRLGEGTGAALGMSIVEAAVKILTEMATFQKAGVSQAVR